MRDDETVHEWIARVKKEDDALGVAVILICVFVLAGVIGAVLTLKGLPLR